MELVKINKTMIGSGYFTHKLEFGYSEHVGKFAEVRQWLIDQWGVSVEFDIWKQLTSKPIDGVNVSPNWSWERLGTNKECRCRIFIRSDEELHWVTLRWL